MKLHDAINRAEEMAVGLEADKAGELRLAEHMRPTDPNYADGRCLLALRWGIEAEALRVVIAAAKRHAEDHGDD